MESDRKDGLRLEKYLDFFTKLDLFKNVQKTDILSMLQCLGAKKCSYKKGEILFLTGDQVPGVGIIMKGSIQIVQDDVAGNQAIVGQLSAGDLFAETFICAGAKQSPVTVTALSPCEVLFLQLERLITTCSSACSFHSRLIENLLRILAAKNIYMAKKNRLLSQRTIHEKLRRFFMDRIEETGAHVFEVELSRNQLADYLCVDRSALSRELSKMKADGMIEFDKKDFKVIKL